MQVLRIPLRIVFYREDDAWIAHCLEFNLLGDGTTREEAFAALREAVEIQFTESIKHDNLMNLFDPADAKYLRMFAAGKDVAVAHFELKSDAVSIVETEAREFCEEDVREGSVSGLVEC